jgi:hypothetical protein
MVDVVVVVLRVDEERGVDVVLLQDVEDLAGERRERPIVERQRKSVVRYVGRLLREVDLRRAFPATVGACGRDRSAGRGMAGTATEQTQGQDRDATDPCGEGTRHEGEPAEPAPPAISKCA